jgi:hypothetical protein
MYQSGVWVMAKKSHKAQAMSLLESLGWRVADVERWIPGTHRTKDLFGFADLLCVKAGVGTLAVQVTSESNVSSRVASVFQSADVKECLLAGWLVEVFGIRNKVTKTGSTVLARFIELTDGGETVTAYAGSNVLPKELTDGSDRN